MGEAVRHRSITQINALRGHPRCCDAQPTGSLFDRVWDGGSSSSTSTPIPAAATSYSLISLAEVQNSATVAKWRGRLRRISVGALKAMVAGKQSAFPPSQ